MIKIKNKVAFKRDRENYKRKAVKAAKELLYGPDVIDLIKKAENDSEISMIMERERRKRE